MRIALLILVSLSLASCASIISGKSSTVALDSKPPGAEVWLDGKQIGITPCQGIIPHKWGKGSLKFVAGEKVHEFDVPRKVTPWFFANGLLGLAGIPGIIVDSATGNWRHVALDSLTVDFENGEPFVVEVRKAEEEEKAWREAQE